jgi:hypothetical protein
MNEYKTALEQAQEDNERIFATHVKLRDECTFLTIKLMKAVDALKVYAMTNETFPEYGDVARSVLKEIE